MDGLRRKVDRNQGSAPRNQPRPDGPLIWIHASRSLDADAKRALRDLYHGIQDTFDVLPTFVVTPSAAEPFVWADAPREPRQVARFLSHWAPNAIIWIDAFEPEIAAACAQAGSPVTVIAPSAEGLLNAAHFDAGTICLAPDPRILRDMITPPESEFAPDPGLLPCLESEVEDLSAFLNGRPVWFTALPNLQELEDVIAAHRAAARVSHRLLLLLSVKPEEAASVSRDLSRGGWQIRHRETGEAPDEQCEIYLFEGMEETGLCLRLSPVTFLGGSFSGVPRLSPEAITAMGAALIAGTKAGTASEQLAEIKASGALVQVEDGEALKDAVIALLAPDKAAELSHNGWAWATRGAPLKEALIDHLRPYLT